MENTVHQDKPSSLLEDVTNSCSNDEVQPTETAFSKLVSGSTPSKNIAVGPSRRVRRAFGSSSTGIENQSSGVLAAATATMDSTVGMSRKASNDADDIYVKTGCSESADSDSESVASRLFSTSSSSDDPITQDVFKSPQGDDESSGDKEDEVSNASSTSSDDEETTQDTGTLDNERVDASKNQPSSSLLSEKSVSGEQESKLLSSDPDQVPPGDEGKDPKLLASSSLSSKDEADPATNADEESEDGSKVFLPSSSDDEVVFQGSGEDVDSHGTDADLEFETQPPQLEEKPIRNYGEDNNDGDANGKKALETKSDQPAEGSNEHTSKLDTEDNVGKESLSSPQTPVLNERSILMSTDNLFLLVEDKETVTVKDILQSLQAEYNCSKLPKPLKGAVRQRLADLINGNVQPLVEVHAEENDSVSLDSATESEQEEHSEEEFEEELSDQDEGIVSKRRNRKKRSARERKTKKSSKDTTTSDGKSKDKAQRPRREPGSSKKKKHSALRIHAEQLRKRRMEELRVRNEELQVQQNAKDQARAELIAAKFETNTDEQRLQRLENRLDLLQKLDRKRIAVIQLEETNDRSTVETLGAEVQSNGDSSARDGQETLEHRNDVVSPTDFEKTETAGTASKLDPEEEGTDSDCDSELEIVDPGEKEAPNCTPKKPDPLSLLEMADRSSIRKKLQSKNTRSFLDLGAAREGKKQPQQACLSPGRSLTARAALRNALLAKQRKMGNMWLARELGYKTEKEHVKDCLEAEEKKRKWIIQREQERLRDNERKNLRQRLLAQQLQQGDADDGDEEYNEEQTEKSTNVETPKEAEEEDEELQLAKAIELERLGVADHVDPETQPPFDANGSGGEGDQSIPDTAEGNGSGASVTDDETNQNAVKDFDNVETAESEKSEQLEPPLETQALQPGSTEIEPLTTEVIACGQSSETDDKDEDGVFSSADNDKNTEAVPVSLDIPDQQPTSSAEANNRGNAGEHEAGDEGVGDSVLSNSEITEAKESQQETKPNGPRNSAWQALLQKEAEQEKRLKKKRKASGALVEEEADEEEEEQVAGLEDFGFSVNKKKKDDEEEEGVDAVHEEDLKHVVDDLSDNEGDEEAGEEARKALERKEEKRRHKEIIQRMRDGYDGRRGGIASGSMARGVHRFDELVAADNREDAKRLGLLNDDELDSDSDNEGASGEKKPADVDEDDDEAALLDKMLKDRFMHRSSVELEEHFSEDEESDQENDEANGNANGDGDHEEKEQDRLAKRFAKRARMQRVLETYGHEEEFSQSRLIEEDTTLKLELQKMKNGLALKRKFSLSRGSSISNQSVNLEKNSDNAKKAKTAASGFGGNFLPRGGSLSLALQASRRGVSRSGKQRTSFLRNVSAGSSTNETTASLQKSIAFSHVVFQTTDSQQPHSRSGSNVSSRNGNSGRSSSGSLAPPRRRDGPTLKKSSKSLPMSSTSLWSKAVLSGFQKRR